MKRIVNSLPGVVIIMIIVLIKAESQVYLGPARIKYYQIAK